VASDVVPVGPYSVVLFDLDGTIIDPRGGFARCLGDALAAVGVEAPPAEELVAHIGPPLLETLRSYGLDDDGAARATEHYRERFAVDGLTGVSVHPGIADLLAELRAAGLRVGVATSKPWPIARDVLGAFELLHLLDPIAGPDLDEVDAAKDRVISRALSALGEPPVRDVVMIGDRLHDVLGAHHHGMDAIAVTWGIGSIEELTACSPRHLVTSAEELRALLLPAA
jgi:phosphoglycolate phosphatase